jgi:DNA-directed RNA polymerase specialized sigma24 family protein
MIANSGALGNGKSCSARDFLRGFAVLPEEQRLVLLLIGVEDFSYQETARILDRCALVGAQRTGT